MTGRILTVALVGALGIVGARADWISSWGDGDPNAPSPDFVISQTLRTITILHGNGLDYKFYSETAFGSGSPGSINNITIDAGATGDFTLLIDHPSASPDLPGALNWRAADLRHPSPAGTCTITGIHVSGALVTSHSGDPPPLDIYCDVVSGNIVAGSLSDFINGGQNLARQFVADSITGNITLGGMFGFIDVGALNGNVSVGNTPGARTPGKFIIRSSYGGTMLFSDPQGFGGRVHIVNGNFSGLIHFTTTGQMEGHVEIDGDFIVPGRIVSEGNIDRPNAGVPPNIHIHGSLANPNAIGSTLPMIHCPQLIGPTDGGLRGVIAIDGDLKNAVTNGPEIKVWKIRDPFEDPPGDPTARGAIAVDYDGWHDGDDWEPGATIEELIPPVENPTVHVYSFDSVNMPGESVYHITPCRGDVNNDGQVTSADIYGLTLARMLPDIGYDPLDTSDCFVDNFSGLEGSILWHGDWTCDNLITCVDPNWHRWFLDNYPGCCIGACPAPRACRADFDRSGSVGIEDLANFLSRFGVCDGNELYNPLYDLVINDCDAIDDVHNVCDEDAVNDDECIGLEDLTMFL